MSLEFVECTKKFKNNLILDKVNFKISKGLFNLTGRNGAGKSTLLKMISGLDKKYSGNIIANNKSTLYLNVDPIGIHPFTIKENLEILWNTFNITPSTKQLSKVNDFFDDNLDVSYSRASTGMKAKLGLSLIFVKDWETILIDETMSSLDSESIDMLAESLVNLSAKEISTIIYVSHSMVNVHLKDNSSAICIGEGNLSWKNMQS
ncbi:ATP-binding cassette domain-containing protein [Bacillus inaquosorum]|uniref:ATP-binding cassette domain-containing protein n=1 Tax=Bacillus inaquosorum TaxID=483913 RepID=UPI0022814FD1|nr:ATP-binding cassette domain-containing protein [Bacillus inaquosorum]MCY7749225.1 ATP-binding cassette domain-containing protein [Bacillus inaquosorum]MCY7910153.1 ATP-binding cassette domain-containing protein [Bacillus inaquosorum]MCY8183150.1 ATP-binding cassette domain-containing protein [Bacillus inaquosorum]MCY8502868.1 ATP-binding cassette domain-containing protein [Bacillus inaquosorum]MCY8862760.1 ATP-binding cassette domain-containing protein [Bacillus inaquosorum]